MRPPAQHGPPIGSIGQIHSETSWRLENFRLRRSMWVHFMETARHIPFVWCPPLVNDRYYPTDGFQNATYTSDPPKSTNHESSRDAVNNAFGRFEELLVCMKTNVKPMSADDMSSEMKSTRCNY